MEFCTYCGQPLDPISGSCPLCGGGNIKDVSGWFIDALKQKLRSPLLLVLTIILTSSALYTMIHEDMFFISLISLIIPICLWITYFSACSSKNNMSLVGIKLISAVITIIQILLWIIFGILIVLAVLLFAAPALISGLTPYFTLFLEEYGVYADLIAEYGTLVMSVLGAVVILTAIIIAIINTLFYGSTNKSIKSVINSFKNGKNLLCKFGAVKVWLIIFSIFECIVLIAAFSISSILTIASYIIGAILVTKISKTSPEDII